VANNQDLFLGHLADALGVVGNVFAKLSSAWRSRSAAPLFLFFCSFWSFSHDFLAMK
jgi:hypothetical protein